MNIRFSPKPVTEYFVPSKSAILSSDEEAWNLCYLSYDWETHAFHPDPQFSVNILRTLQFIVDTGEIDLSRECLERTVRTFLRSTPHVAVRRILAMKRVHDLPMVQAYGSQWLKTISDRTVKWQEPFDAVLDQKVVDLSQALAVIGRCRE